ncbi:hypothetical protein A2949_02390 [Candidatus Adlerbacteria bacterium RIFCSPLOWO2_01_FULL_54_21b]|uniref:Uncharacterized protein n=1 Tax=Candidatus Adlerbacteria bacterium RIFCSPLOWO2_01_FULL_54_21b TaxID=1797245 RepID=A0A1F4XYC0_9BACT|nr:MAG: hypothetical protein A2949_02390 [Candidatus Adlerbacteria bacterium RIFCSPLOWO2_01_FULL_54_21b]
MKLMLLIMPAFFLDGLQAGVAFGLSGLGPPGILLGFAVCICLSLTFGWFIILLLGSQGMFYPGLIGLAFIGESIPGFGFLPSWTGLVVASYTRSLKDAPGVVGMAATAVALATHPRTQALRTLQNKTNFTAARDAARTMVGKEMSERHPRAPLLPDRTYAKTA